MAKHKTRKNLALDLYIIHGYRPWKLDSLCQDDAKKIHPMVIPAHMAGYPELDVEWVVFNPAEIWKAKHPVTKEKTYFPKKYRVTSLTDNG